MGSFGLGSTSLSSGIDVQSLVQQVLFAASAPVRQLQQQDLRLTNQVAALGEITTKLAALDKAVNALKDLSGKFNSKAVTSSDTNILSASATGVAATAAHLIVVSSLAATSSYYSSQLANSTTTFGAGSFSLSVGGGAPTTITVDATNNTLDGLAVHINTLNLGVTASVITDASGARLSLLSNASGAAGDLVISGNTTGLTFTKAATGANASLTINGVPISSATNSISAAVPGVTFTQAGADPAKQVTVTVKPDVEKAQEAVDEFVAAYNAVVSAVNAQFTFSQALKTSGPLSGSAALRSVQQRLLSAATFSIAGNNGFISLSTIGVDLGNDGALTVDSTKLKATLESNFGDVQNLFQSQTAPGFAVNFSGEMDVLTDSTQGPLKVELDGVNNTKTSIVDQIAGFQARLEVRRQSLTQEFSRVSALLEQLPVLLAQINSQLAGL